MSKYRRLTEYLHNLKHNEWHATFKNIEGILGFELPASAYSHQAWWANQQGGQAQRAAWQDAGWRTENLNLEEQTVTFFRNLNAFAKHHHDPFAYVSNAFAKSQNAFLPGIAPPNQNASGQNSFLEGLTKDVRPLTIAEAKAGLAAAYGISEDCIEILIKG